MNNNANSTRAPTRSISSAGMSRASCWLWARMRQPCTIPAARLHAAALGARNRPAHKDWTRSACVGLFQISVFPHISQSYQMAVTTKKSQAGCREAGIRSQIGSPASDRCSCRQARPRAPVVARDEPADFGECARRHFQRLQKYERGANRVSASRLVAIAEALRVPISYFRHRHLGSVVQRLAREHIRWRHV